MIKISVIIPVFNVENYLARCLDSVCNQTLKDIEIICVDDCSSDGSAQIMKQYAKNYQNLTILHLKKNQGVSVARNLGLSLAKGEYVAFVDSDDEIDLRFYEKLYEKAQENNADLVRGQAIEISYEGKRRVVNQIPEGSKWFFLSYWLLAIYKRSLIVENNISFPINYSLGEDLLFLNQAIIVANNLFHVNDVYYYYHRREDSGDSKFLSQEKIKSAINAYEIITDRINTAICASDPVYSFIFHHFIIGCFYVSLKSHELDSKKICAAAIINIFEKCRNKDGLKINFSKTAPYLFMLLNNQDNKAVEDFVIKCKSYMELISSGLRARIKNK